MTHQDWRNKTDYDYTAVLDLQGWAWEFIRRNIKYEEFYWKCRQENRLDEVTGAEWYLERLYEPWIEFNPNIRFLNVNPFPIFAGFPTETINPETEEIIVDFPGLIDAKDLSSTLPNGGGGEVILVAFDTSRPITHQLKKAQEFLEFHRDRNGARAEDPFRIRADVWPRYLRMLDAERADPELSQSEKIRIIEPNNWQNRLDNELSDYASDTLQRAVAMTVHGYRNLLRRLQTHG